MTQPSPEYWEQRATDRSRTSLDTVRASATAWAATTTTLIGVFGTVAVVKGPDTLAQLAGVTRDVVTGLVIGAAVIASVSVLATAYASRGPTKRFAPLTGLQLALWTRTTTRNARRALLVGQATAVVSAVCILAAGITAAVGTSNGAPSDAFYLVRTSGGGLQCGVLARSAGTLVLENGSSAVLLNLSSGVASVTPVPSCPG
ncbi:MAG: hypothetical protein ABSA02_32985 [Trebonia sp.]